MTLAARLPEYPWDELAPIAEKARAFPGGAVDLSIGTPVDPVPEVIQDALRGAANAPGYPLTAGTPGLRAAAAGWLSRSLGVDVDPVTVLPVIGTKEFIAWLPTMLGLGAGDTVLYPDLAYPTYDIGARLAGAASVPVDDLSDDALAAAPSSARLRWVNSPSNPSGRVLSAGTLRSAVGWARSRGCVLASDECYIELGWDVTPVSVLHPSVRGDSLDGILAVFSLSKRSNLAGYRAGFVTGDPAPDEGPAACRQAGRDDRARPRAGGDDRGAVRRRPRGRAEGQVRGAPCGACRGAHRGGLPHRALRGRAVPVGDAARVSTAGRRASCSPPSAASWPAPAPCTGPRGTRTSGSR